MLNITSKQDGSTLELKLSGRLDVNTAKNADKAFTEAVESADSIVLDCSELEYCSSAGLRAIKRLRLGARAKGASLVLRGVQDGVMEVFELTGFAALLKFE